MITSANVYGVQPVQPYEPTPVQEAVSSVLNSPNAVETLLAESVRGRLTAERRALNTNIEKLEAFLLSEKFKNLTPERAKELLLEQLTVMRQYSSILFERIAVLEE